jgi:hypothetical protein
MPEPRPPFVVRMWIATKTDVAVHFPYDARLNRTLKDLAGQRGDEYDWDAQRRWWMLKISRGGIRKALAFKEKLDGAGVPVVVGRVLQSKWLATPATQSGETQVPKPIPPVFDTAEHRHINRVIARLRDLYRHPHPD